MAFSTPADRSERSADVIESASFICLTCLCVAAAVALVARSAATSGRRTAFRIDDTINPNNASPASLSRLPRIGPTRARGIVSCRGQSREGARPGPAFTRAEDLRKVPGIGPATIEAIRPWLSFDSQPSSEPDAAAGPQP